MEKSQLLAKILASRAALEGCLSRLDLDQWELAGVCGEWSAKDVLAHITWHEAEMIGVLKTRTLAGSPLWDQPTDRRNAVIYIENRGRTLEDVRGAAGPVFRELLGLLEGLSQAELDDPARFTGMPGDWTPRELFSGNTWEHYDDHTRQIQAWLDAAGAHV